MLFRSPQHLKTVKSVFPEWPVEKLECVQLLVKIGLSAKRINEITGVPAVVPYTIKQRGLW